MIQINILKCFEQTIIRATLSVNQLYVFLLNTTYVKYYAK